MRRRASLLYLCVWLAVTAVFLGFWLPQYSAARKAEDQVEFLTVVQRFPRTSDGQQALAHAMQRVKEEYAEWKQLQKAKEEHAGWSALPYIDIIFPASDWLRPLLIADLTEAERGVVRIWVVTRGAVSGPAWDGDESKLRPLALASSDFEKMARAYAKQVVGYEVDEKLYREIMNLKSQSRRTGYRGGALVLGLGIVLVGLAAVGRGPDHGGDAPGAA